MSIVAGARKARHAYNESLTNLIGFDIKSGVQTTSHAGHRVTQLCLPTQVRDQEFLKQSTAKPFFAGGETGAAAFFPIQEQLSTPNVPMHINVPRDKNARHIYCVGCKLLESQRQHECVVWRRQFPQRTCALGSAKMHPTRARRHPSSSRRPRADRQQIMGLCQRANTALQSLSRVGGSRAARSVCPVMA